jgi:nicotinate-nucleotide pyrophosphorylase (carboxylating)
MGLGQDLSIPRKKIMTKDYETLLTGWAVEDPFYEEIFGNLAEQSWRASLRSRSDGWLAGIPLARKAAETIGLEAIWRKQSGEKVFAGEEIAEFRGSPQQIVKFENLVIGLISKPSGIASAAQKARKLASGKVRLVSGGWKKHPFPIKDMVLEAVTAGGIAHRIVDEPLIYLDKNYVRIFGGISQALQAVASHAKTKVIQLRGEFLPITEEAREALSLGADVLMVDTGSWKDLDEVLGVMREKNLSYAAKLAFAGGIKLVDIPLLTRKGVDILDIGAAILDAPWLELTYDVMGKAKD